MSASKLTLSVTKRVQHTVQHRYASVCMGEGGCVSTRLSWGIYEYEVILCVWGICEYEIVVCVWGGICEYKVVLEGDM